MQRKTFFSIYGYIQNRTGIVLEWEHVETLERIRRLANRHHALAEMDCNGEGVVRGVRYYNGTIDNWARQQYGAGVKSAYIGEDETIFEAESAKIVLKINIELAKLPSHWKAIFQGDPRGATVRLILNGDDVTSMWDL